MRCLQKLAHEYKYKRTSQIIFQNFCVDDVLTACETVEERINLLNEITHILLRGVFELCILASSYNEILPTSTQETTHSKLINFDKNGEIKTLRMIWNCHKDIFKYQFNFVTRQDNITKRTILETIAQIIDPLGLIVAVK